MKVLQKKVEKDQVSGTPTPINIQVSLSLFSEIKLHILCNIIAALVSLPSEKKIHFTTHFSIQTLTDILFYYLLFFKYYYLMYFLYISFHFSFSHSRSSLSTQTQAQNKPSMASSAIGSLSLTLALPLPSQPKPHGCLQPEKYVNFNCIFIWFDLKIWI
jgi:hypothetical protein